MTIPNIDQQYQIWLSIVIVIIGGFVTYYVTSFIDRRKYRSDLKKQTYFELLELIGELSIIIYYFKDYDENTTRKSIPKTSQEISAMQTQLCMETDTLKKMIEWIKKFVIVSYKVLICGNSEVITILNKAAPHLNSAKKLANLDMIEFHKFEVALINAIKKDLMEISLIDRLSWKIKKFIQMFI